jgi:hypothetical protein
MSDWRLRTVLALLVLCGGVSASTGPSRCAAHRMPTRVRSCVGGIPQLAEEMQGREACEVCVHVQR